MRKLMVIFCILLLTGCGYSQNEHSKGLEHSLAQDLPLIITENEMYELSLIDVYMSEDEEDDPCYIFKFEFVNKYDRSNIRAALVDASINDYSLSGSSRFHSDDSFSVYTWSGKSPKNTAVDCFMLYESDIKQSTDIRNRYDLNNASLSFVFRVYVVEEMDGYGEDAIFTIENAFQYCS